VDYQDEVKKKKKKGRAVDEKKKKSPVFHSYKTHLTTRKLSRPWRNFGGLKNAEKRKKAHGGCLLATQVRAMLCARLHAKLKQQHPTCHGAH
jgi:hypothetical protein